MNYSDTVLLSSKNLTRPTHGIVTLTAYAQKTLLMPTLAYESSMVSGLHFGSNLYLHPYFVYASSLSSGECRLETRNKYPNLRF